MSPLARVSSVVPLWSAMLGSVRPFVVRPQVRLSPAAVAATRAFVATTLRSTDVDVDAIAATSAIVEACLGGDHAGQSATYDGVTGALVRVPEHLVPESMVEWGAVPACLEVLASETLSSGSSSMRRTTVTVLPEVGCGVDNLETTIRTIESPTSTAGDVVGWVDDGGVAVAARFERATTTTTTATCETIFCATNDDGERTRVRVRRDLSLSSETGGATTRGPVVVVSERRADVASSDGAVARGGGLDAATVARLVGTDNINRPFAEEAEKDRGETVVVDADDGGSWLRLPLGITVRTTTTTTTTTKEGGASLELIVSRDDENDVGSGGRLTSRTEIRWDGERHVAIMSCEKEA